jgi:hypothetical protein
MTFSLFLSLSLSNIYIMDIYIILTSGGRFIKGRDLLFSAAIMAVLLLACPVGVEGAKADTDPAKRAERRSFIFLMYLYICV